MRKILLLLLTIGSCLSSLADSRGVSFEKDGLVYIIASEYILNVPNVGRAKGEPEFKILHEGEVYVSGVTVSDCDLVIPRVVSFASNYCSKDTVTCKYNVLGIGAKAFAGARLKSLVIPYGLKFIGDEAFRNMEVTGGVLVVPPTRRIKADVFDGVKGKVFFADFVDRGVKNAFPTKFENTFRNSDVLPELYTSHYGYFSNAYGVTKTIFYTVGANVYNQWVPDSVGNESYNEKYRSVSIAGSERASFVTYGAKDAPKVTVRSAKSFPTTGLDIDLFAPYEYECRNSYTHQKEIYQEFILNGTLFRGKKGKDYYYFTLDGKPITDKESLLDSDGQDPFGLQVVSPEEIKAKREAKEREKILNNKMNSLKMMFDM